MLSVVVMFYRAGTGGQNVWPVVTLEGCPLQCFLSSAAPVSLGIAKAGILFLVFLVATLLLLLELRDRMVSSAVPCTSHSKNEEKLQVAE